MSTGPAHLQQALRADCSKCFGLCCVALPFAASADFAIDKPAGVPCPNLLDDFGCEIHNRLRQSGFRGCTVFDCHGAGQRVSQQTFAGRDWRTEPGTAREMFAILPVMQHLHELMGHLLEALGLTPAAALHGEVTDALLLLDGLGDGSPAELLDLDRGALQAAVGDLLLRVSVLVRAQHAPGGADHRGADLVGADLRGAQLAGASLRGALLVAADLRGADLRWADLVGADLRGADLGGADLGAALFLTQAQLDSARGDERTSLPERLSRPAHWRD